MRIAALSILLCPLSVQAQVRYHTRESVLSAFKDAEYAFSRFEDVTGDVAFDRWRAPSALREKEMKALRAIRAEEEGAKRIVVRVERSQESISGLDLLNVYSALGTCAIELTSLSCDAQNFQEAGSTDIEKASEASALSVDLARAASTALDSQTKLRVILHSC